MYVLDIETYEYISKISQFIVHKFFHNKKIDHEYLHTM
jgi:hypothetical protein